MFIVTKYNKKENKVTILDTDDMKEDIFELNELLVIVNKFKLNVIGLDSLDGLMLYGKVFRSYEYFLVCSTAQENYKNLEKFVGVAIFGHLGLDVDSPNYNLVTSDKCPVQDSFNTYSYTYLEQFIVRFLTAYSEHRCDKSLFKILLIKMYLDLSLTNAEYRSILAYFNDDILRDIKSNITILDVKDRIVFTDNKYISIVLNRKAINDYNIVSKDLTKLLVLIKNVKFDKLYKKLIIQDCEQFKVSNNRFIYYLPSIVKINTLIIENGAKLQLDKNKSDYINLNLVVCYDFKIFKRLNKSQIKVLRIPVRFWLDCNYNLEDLCQYGCIVEFLEDSSLDDVKQLYKITINGLKNKMYTDCYSDSTYTYLEEFFNKFNIKNNIRSRFNIEETKDNFISLFKSIFSPQEINYIFEYLSEDEIYYNIDYFLTRGNSRIYAYYSSSRLENYLVKNHTLLFDKLNGLASVREELKKLCKEFNIDLVEIKNHTFKGNFNYTFKHLNCKRFEINNSFYKLEEVNTFKKALAALYSFDSAISCNLDFDIFGGKITISFFSRNQDDSHTHAYNLLKNNSDYCTYLRYEY